MDYKVVLTKQFLEQLGLPSDDATIAKYLFIWWQNPRKEGASGLKLREEGFLTLTTKLNIKAYPIRFPKETVWTSQLIVRLNKFIDCPYYIDKKEIYVFSERMAIQLVLFSGDITKFGLAKFNSVAKKQQESREELLDKTA